MKQHRKLHLLLTTVLTATALLPAMAGAQAPSEKDRAKKYFAAVDPQTRLNLIGFMRVRKLTAPATAGEPRAEDDKDNRSEKIDVVELLRERCQFDYRRDGAGHPVRPQVECTYKPKEADDGFNGMSAKFDCRFESADPAGKARTLKVKYDPAKAPGGGYKEIPQAVMGTLTARLLGFYTNIYCPVDVICKDCPGEHPWGQHKSQAPAVPGNRVVFENVVVEVKQKGDKVIDRRHVNSEKPQGFGFGDEMARYAPRDAALQAELLTERQTLAIWQNFVHAKDADRHNNKLLCARARTAPGADPVCELSVGSINDYGNAFGYTDSRTPLRLSGFARDSLSGSGSSVRTSGASGNAGSGGYPVTMAGRDLFVSMADSLTDSQLNDIFELAQVGKTSDAGVDQWRQVYRQKVQKIKDLRMR